MRVHSLILHATLLNCWKFLRVYSYQIFFVLTDKGNGSTSVAIDFASVVEVRSQVNRMLQWITSSQVIFALFSGLYDAVHRLR